MSCLGEAVSDWGTVVGESLAPWRSKQSAACLTPIARYSVT